MSGGGGGSGNDGSNDMQVSGAEAAYSNEKGISTNADTRTSTTSYSGGGGEGNNTRPNPHTDSGTSKTSRSLGPDRSTVGIAAPDTNYSQSEIEKGYTDEGVQLSNVNGTYMTKAEMYSTGIIEKDPTTGKDVQGRYTVNPNTGEYERTDMSFAEHWQNAPEALKFSPTMRFLYATGRNIGEWSNKRGFKGYNEAGARGKLGNATDYYVDRSSGSNDIKNIVGGGDNERDRMNTIAPHAPYIVSGIAPPSSSPAANWFANLGTTNTNNSNNIGLQYANAKQAIAKTLNNKGALGMLAVNDSPYYDWLKTKGLDKGIL
jgi:hypothetical protein